MTDAKKHITDIIAAAVPPSPLAEAWPHLQEPHTRRSANLPKIDAAPETTQICAVSQLAPSTPAESAEPKVTALAIDEFLEIALPPRQIILRPWLATSSISMIAAIRGVGKTQVAIGVAWAVSSGGKFLRWCCDEPRRVLFLDGEMPGTDLQARFKAIIAASGYELADPGYLKIAASDLTPHGLPDLGVANSQGLYEDLVADADVIIVDNISTLCPSVPENDADGWVVVQQWCLAQRRAGRSVLLVHHAGKSGVQRGSSRKEDVLDSVISLRRPPDYSADQGCRFELRYDKARGFHGTDAAPFEARLVDGKWLISDLAASDNLETLKALRAQGLSIRDIAERTGLSKSTVQRRLGEE